jgi:hypothetical protein
MLTFSIDQSAVIEIQRIFRQSNCDDPAAVLYEAADPGNLFDDFGKALLEGAKTGEDMSAMGKKRFEEVGDQLKSWLVVGACERKDIRTEDLVEVGGLAFVMRPEVAEMLREYRLTFEDGRFLLRGADNTAHTLRSIAKKL